MSLRQTRGDSVDQAEEHARDWFRRQGLKCPTQKRLHRWVRSANRVFELRYFQRVDKLMAEEDKQRIDQMLSGSFHYVGLSYLKKHSGAIGLDSVLKQIDKLNAIRAIILPAALFDNTSLKVLARFKQRVNHETTWELKQHPSNIRYGLVAAYLQVRQAEIIDELIDLFMQVIRRMERLAEKRAARVSNKNQHKSHDRMQLLYRVADAVHRQPNARVDEAIAPLFGEDLIEELLSEYRQSTTSYEALIHGYIYGSYTTHYRRMLPRLLGALEFESNNKHHRPVLDAIELLRRYQGSRGRFFPDYESVPIKDVIRPKWRTLISGSDDGGPSRISRAGYELCVLRTLRERLRCKEIWVVGANKYRNPDLDLPSDFESKREFYYDDLGHSLDADEFTSSLQKNLRDSLCELNGLLPNSRLAHINAAGRNRITLTPLKPQREPFALHALKKAVASEWPGTALLDVLKEADLRIGFTDFFRSTASREILNRESLQERLLLCLYGMGTNTGMKRVVAGTQSVTYKELLHTRRHHITKAAFQNAVGAVVNATLAARQSHIWGEGTTACASDSKQFGAWDQNLMTEWHLRYGGRGVMIYWHVEKQSTCIHSQLKRVSSSEVASMIEGVLRHCTDMSIERQYVDSHGQSEVGFAFSYLLGFDLLPRLKAIGRQKLHRVGGGYGDNYENLKPVLARPIRWDLINQQYDEMIKFATALKQGTADAESILRRFTRNNARHPTYQALSELGKAVKTIFLCRYIGSEDLRREIHEGLNVVENWNSANSFIFFGKGGEVAANDIEEQELSVWALHLLQICLVYVNTLMIQQVFTDPKWATKMREEDYRALTPLIYNHINPYGTFDLDMNQRIIIERAA